MTGVGALADASHTTSVPSNDAPCLPAALDAAAPNNAEQKQKDAIRKRLACVDVLRGITMAVMVFVDMTGGAWPEINHHPWNGIHLADFVMPSFLFLVGISGAIVLRNPGGQRVALLKKIVWRAVKLFFVGLLVQGRWFWTVDLAKIRIMGILQRIALAYLAAGVIKIFVPETAGDVPNDSGWVDLWLFRRYMHQWSATLLTLVAYIVVMHGVAVPKSGCHAGAWMTETGTDDVRCNIAGWIDSSVLGREHLYIPEPGFDPEGFATTLGCIFTVYMGVHFGHTHLALKDLSPWRCWRHWLLLSGALLAVGFALWPLVPPNKRMWSLSYNFITTGSAALLCTLLRALELISAGPLSAAVIAPASQQLLDTHQASRAEDRSVSRNAASWGVKGLEPMRMLGTNALLFFVWSDSCGLATLLITSVYWKKPENNLVVWFIKTVLLGWFGCQCHGWEATDPLSVGGKQMPPNQCGMILVYATLEISLWCVICWLLYRKNWFWKL